MLIPPAPRVPVAPCLQLCSFVAKGVAPLFWVKFKAFLQKSQGNLRVFVYITWNCIRQDFQYQQKEVLHWASHIEHPQSIEFDADKASEKPDLNWFFQTGDGEKRWQGKMARKEDKERWQGRMMTSLLTHLSPYALVSLHTWLPTHLFHRYIYVLIGRIFCLSIYLRSSTCQGMQVIILNCCSMRQGSWAVSWTQSTLLPCVVVSFDITIGQNN